MACESDVGLKNLVLTFRDCNTGEEISAISHNLAEDTQFEWNACPYTRTSTSGRKTRVSKASVQINFTVVPSLSIPSNYYTGCAEMDVSAEFYSGRVITATNGSIVDASAMNEESVAIQARFDVLDEIRV